MTVLLIALVVVVGAWFVMVERPKMAERWPDKAVADEHQETIIRAFGVVDGYEDELFVVAPDRLGFGFIGQPISGAENSQFEAMNGLLNLNYPAGAALQVSLWLNPDIEETLHDYAVRRKDQQHPLLRAYTADKIEFMRDLTRNYNPATGAKLRAPRLIVTITVPQGPKEPTSDQKREIRELRNAMIAQFKAIGLRMQTMSAATYIRTMETILNHGPDAVWRRSPWADHNDNLLICNQLLDSDTKITVSKNEISLGEHAKVRVLHPKTYPEIVYPGMAMRYVGDLLKGQKQVKEPMLLTVNMLYSEQTGVRERLQQEYAWNTKQAEGPMARMIPDWARQRDSQRIAMDAMEKGDRMIQAKIGLAVFAPNSDRAAQASTEATSMMRDLGFHVMEDHFALLPMFLSLMPFSAERDIAQGLARYTSTTTRHFVPFLPMFSSWAGTGTPLLLLFGRDEGLMTFSPYDTDGNMNMIIAAQSGMGKSFASNELIMNFLTIGGRCWVIDKGFSYKPLTDVMGGSYIEFAADNNLCLNPFEIVKSWEEESDILASLVTIMAAPKEGLSDFQLPSVRRVMGELWKEKGRSMTIDDIAEALKLEDDKRLVDIGLQLYPFTTAGEYGRFFNGKNNCDLNNHLVVLELQQLEGRKHLQRLILLQVMYQIQIAMTKLPRDTPKLLLIDEAFQLLASDETKEFIIAFYRQLRKWGASCTLATQSVNDFYAGEGAAAIMENSAHMLLLGQKSESIAMVKQHGRMPMSEGGFKLLETVHTVKGSYSEILIRNSFGIGVGRLIVSEFLKVLYSTDAKTVEARKGYLARGMDMHQACMAVVEEQRMKKAA